MIKSELKSCLQLDDVRNSLHDEYDALLLELGMRLRRVRLGKGLSLAAAAVLMNMSMYTMYNIEQGLYCSIELLTLDYMATQYQVDVADLLNDLYKQSQMLFNS